MFLVSCTPKWDPRKYRRVEIVDAGEIYSTFDINKHEKEKKILDKKRWLPDSVLRKVTAASSESRWPPAIQTPQLRHDNQKKMKQYKAYLITSFKNKHILYIPNAENKGANIAPELMSDRDFYMIIGKKGIERKDEFMKGYENWTRPPRPKKPTAPVAAAPSRTSVKPDAKNTAVAPDKKSKGAPNFDEKEDLKGLKPNTSADAKTKNAKEKEASTPSKPKAEKPNEDKSSAKVAKGKEEKANGKIAKGKKEKPNAKKEKEAKTVKEAKEKEAGFDKGKLTGATKKRIISEKGKKKKKKKKAKNTKKVTAPSSPKSMEPPKSEKGGEVPKAGKE